MSPYILGLIAIVVFLILAFNHMPIAFAFALVGFAGLVWLRGLDSAFQIIGGSPFAWATGQMLLPLPLFVLMGQLTFYSGISRDLYETAHRWIGRLPGGIAMATTLASTAFGACCGVSMAAAASMGGIAFPEMEKLNYNRRLSTGCIAAGGGLSSLIPPSVPFIIIGFITSTSISQLFIAGILPGLLLSGLFLMTIFMMCSRNPRLGPRGASFSLKEKLISLKGVWGMLILFVLVIGGLYAGLFTPSEAGAAGAFGALVISLAGRRLGWANFMNAARDTLKTTCFILTMVIGAMIFNTFLAVTGLPAMFGEWLRSLTYPPLVVLSLLLLIYIPLGMFLDMGAVLLLTVPIIFVPLVNLGFEPLYLGVLIVVMAELGMLTPPVGLNAFIVHGVTKVPLGEVFRGITTFAIVMVVGIAILVAFPEISLILPTLMR